MNWSEMEEGWENLKRLVTTYWPLLEEEDLSRINGNRRALAHLLRQRYRFDEDEAEDAIGV